METLRQVRRRDGRPRERDTLWRKECQRTVYAFQAANAFKCPVRRMRAKLGRWKLGDTFRHTTVFGDVRERTPEWQSRRAVFLLRMLGELVPPRVQAAVFSTIWNRWTTARRFQGRARCLLGCGGQAQDSVEHYCRCAALQAVCQSMLRLDPAVFCNLHAFLLVNPRINTKETLTAVALAIYSVYTCTCRARWRGACSATAAVDAIKQGVREGAKGHGKALRVLRTRWGPEPPATPLPAPPLVPLGDQVADLRRVFLSTQASRRVRPRRA